MLNLNTSTSIFTTSIIFYLACFALHLLLKEVLGSFAVVTEQRKKVPGHVELNLSGSTFTEMIKQDHLTERDTWT